MACGENGQGFAAKAGSAQQSRIANSSFFICLLLYKMLACTSSVPVLPAPQVPRVTVTVSLTARDAFRPGFHWYLNVVVPTSVAALVHTFLDCVESAIVS